MDMARRRTVIGWCAFPVHFVVDKMHQHIPAVRFRNSRRVFHCLVGLVIMLIGAWLSDYLAPVFGKLLADTLGYGVHGLGLAPFAKMAEDYLIGLG